MYSYEPLWKTLRDKGLPQKHLYEEVGLHRGTVTKMSKGGPVSIVVIDRICERMGLDITSVVCCGAENKEGEA